MSDDKNVRHRFTVPVADKTVNQWIESQSNLGFSLRVLIRAFVRDYGNQDATCLELGTEVKKRGRPPKQARIQLGQMMDDGYDNGTDSEIDDQPRQLRTRRYDNAAPDQSVQTVSPVQPVKSVANDAAKPAETQSVAVPVEKSVETVEKLHKPAEQTKEQAVAPVLGADDIMSAILQPTPKPVENTVPKSVPESVSDDSVDDIMSFMSGGSMPAGAGGFDSSDLLR